MKPISYPCNIVPSTGHNYVVEHIKQEPHQSGELQAENLPQRIPGSLLSSIECASNHIRKFFETIGRQPSQREYQVIMNAPSSDDLYRDFILERSREVPRYIGEVLFNLLLSEEWRKETCGEYKKDLFDKALGASLKAITENVDKQNHLRNEDFKGKRTAMNTTLERSPILDLAVEKFVAQRSGTKAKMVDFGVGFPPVTTVATARRFSDSVDLIGIDNSIPDFLVIIEDEYLGRCLALIKFSPEKALECISVQMETDYPSEFRKYSLLTADDSQFIFSKALEGISEIFNPSELAELADLSFEVRASPRSEKSIGKLRTKLGQLQHLTEESPLQIEFQPIIRHATTCRNLQFCMDDLSFSAVEDLDIIRFGNVLLDCYYTDEEANQAIRIAGSKLLDGGILIVVAGDDVCIVFTKSDGVLKPDHCFVRLCNHSVPYRISVNFEGIEALDGHIQSSLSFFEPFGGFFGGPMSNVSCNRLVQKFKELGYQASYEMEDQHSWLRINLRERLR